MTRVLQHTKMCSVANLRQADETLRRNDTKNTAPKSAAICCYIRHSHGRFDLNAWLRDIFPSYTGVNERCDLRVCAALDHFARIQYPFGIEHAL